MGPRFSGITKLIDCRFEDKMTNVFRCGQIVGIFTTSNAERLVDRLNSTELSLN